MDSSTMEACARLEALEHRLSGESYWDYVKGLAAEADVDVEDAAAVRRFDRSREGRKTSNEEWFVVPTPAGRELPCATRHPQLHVAVKAAGEMIASPEGVKMLRKRGERVERSFAHLLDAGGMRRTTLVTKSNIQKRNLIAAAAFNLSILWKAIFGFGTPKQFAAGNRVGKWGGYFTLLGLWAPFHGILRAWSPFRRPETGPHPANSGLLAAAA